MNDKDILRRCRKGDRGAQRELYDRTAKHIYGLLLRMTQDPDDAFDLSQDTYIRAFERIGQFDGRSSLSTWLYRIAVNEALQFLRREQRARRNLGAVVPGDPLTTSDNESASRMDVSRALTALEPSDRGILLLKYQYEFDYKCIAEIMGCAPGTVGSRLNRARQRMRELLPGYSSAEGAEPVRHPKDGGLDAPAAGEKAPDAAP